MKLFGVCYVWVLYKLHDEICTKNKPRESNYRYDSADLISSLQQQSLPEHTKYNSLTEYWDISVYLGKNGKKSPLHKVYSDYSVKGLLCNRELLLSYQSNLEFVTILSKIN